METWALFEDGSASPIVYGFFAPDPDGEPVRLTFPDIHDLEVRISVNNGCLSAYHNLSAQEHILAGDRFVLSCQFADARTGIKAQGGSAGLAFCLHFAREVLADRPDRIPDFSIAATGVVSDSTGEARVRGVRGIQTKLDIALNRLQEGDWVFFPTENEPEVGQPIREKASRKGIELIPVTTVEQAIGKLLATDEPATEPPPPKHAPLRSLLVLFLIVGISALLWYFSSESPDRETFIAQATKDLEYGRYDEVRDRLKQYPEYSSSEDEEIRPLYRLIEKPLAVDLTFFFRNSRGESKRPVPLLSSSFTSEISLGAGDAYWLECAATDSCFLYAFQIDSRGKVNQLPESATTYSALLEPGKLHRLPGKGWFHLDQNKGIETIYLVATRMRSRDLEDIYQLLLADSTVEKENYRENLLKGFKSRKRALTAGLEGIYYADFSFLHISDSEE